MNIYTVGVGMFVITLKKEYKRDYRRVMPYSLFFAVVYVLKFECIKPQLEPWNVFQQLFYFEV